MDNSRPSSHPPRGPGLDRARGTMLEALVALRNLSSLVRSRKVGPRAILDLVPDVRAACEPLPQATIELASAIEANVTEPGVLELKAFLGERIGTLEQELRAAERSSMNARQRLHLEQVLSRLVCELGGGRALLGLLESAVFEQTFPLDIIELMLQTYAGPKTGAEVHELIAARVRGDGKEIPTLKPRSLVALLACGVELVAAQRSATPQVSLGSDADGWFAEVTLSDAPEGLPLTISGYCLVPPTLSCVEAAAQCLGLCLTWSPEVPRLLLKGRG